MDPALRAGGGVAAGWRDADEALLQRLTDERAVEQLWLLEAPAGARPLPRRASVLAREVRRSLAGGAAVERAAEGDAVALAALLRATMTGWSGALLHAAAIYFGRLARELERAQAEAEARADRARVATLGAAEQEATLRELAAWIALAEERTFLGELVARVAGGALSGAELEALVGAAAERTLSELGARAARAAPELEPRGAAALRCLARTHDACKLAGVSGATMTGVAKVAERARARAVDDALAPLDDELRAAQARGAPTSELAALLSRVRAAWEWAGRDEAVERFALERAIDPAWEIYRRVAWAELRALLSPCEPLFESMEARLLAERSEIAYAAHCAQTLVFRSELETDREREWAFAERALALCPSHRNGRLVMADLLAQRALTLLSAATASSARRDREQAAALIARAEATFAGRARTKEAQQRLAELEQRWGLA